MKRVRLTLKFTLLFWVAVTVATALPLANTGEVKASGGIIYVPDDYPTIQAAVDA